MNGASGRQSGAQLGESALLAPPELADWQVRGRRIQLGRPLVVGVLNVTPDSFSDAGSNFTLDRAVARAGEMLDEGVDIIDIGGESTRPQGAVPVSVTEEMARVVPVVTEISQRYPSCAISVDTVKSRVAAAALEAGAHIVNDVSGARLDARMASTVAEWGAGMVLMHSRGEVSDMATYEHARYGSDPMAEVIGELIASAGRALSAGVSEEQLVLDPGIGFSKTTVQSIAVLRELRRLTALGYPVMVGVSRKRFVGELSSVALPSDRVFGSVAANVIALLNGARLFRVHDVRGTREALSVAWGILSGEEG